MKKFTYLSLICVFALQSFNSFGQWSTGTGGIYYNSGRVGIGLGSPPSTNKLHIYESNGQHLLKVENNRNSDAGIEFETTLANFKIGAGIGTASNQFTIYDINAGASRFFIDGDGRVGIGGTPFVATKLYVGGNTYVTGAVSAGTYVTHSDLRLKANLNEDIQTHSNIFNLKTYSYSLKQDPSGRKQHGVLAQELREILPELVIEQQDGYLAVNYIGMIPLLIRAVQDQQQTIDALSKKIERLNSQDNSLLMHPEARILLVYPNPSQGTATFKLQFDAHSKSKIEIVNLNGQVVDTVDTTNRSSVDLNTSSLKNGVYFSRYVIDGTTIETQRLVIEN